MKKLRIQLIKIDKKNAKKGAVKTASATLVNSVSIQSLFTHCIQVCSGWFLPQFLQ